MRVVDVVVCCDLDCWDFNSFCLERGIEGLKDHLVVCMSKDIALSNEKYTTEIFSSILAEQQQNYFLFQQKKTGQLVFIPKFDALSSQELLSFYGMKQSQFEPLPLDIDTFLVDLQNDLSRRQRVKLAKLKEIERRKQIISQQNMIVDMDNQSLPDYPMALEDPYNPLLNRPKEIGLIFGIFDKNADVIRNIQLAGHGGNRQAITSFFLPNFHTVLSLLKELNVQLLFLDSCCTGGENSQHLYAQALQPRIKRTDAWNDLTAEPESVPFPIIISTIGNIFTYGTRSNAKKLFEVVTEKMSEKRAIAFMDIHNKESIPQHITAMEWNAILGEYEDHLKGERKIRHLMQILLPHSKFTLGGVQLLNPDGKFFIINAIEVSKVILREKFEQQKNSLLPHNKFSPVNSNRNPFIFFNLEKKKIEKAICKIVVPSDIQLISLRITHIPVTVRLEAILEDAPAILSSVPGVQHHYFEILETPAMNLDDCWRAIHSYNQHDDAFRELLTEKAYFFKKLIAKDREVNNVLMYPVENEDKESLIKNFDRVCYQKGHQYLVRQLKTAEENYLTQGIPATFRGIYEERPCTELQYMLELLAMLVRTKPKMSLRGIVTNSQSEDSFRAIFTVIENSCYAPILKYIHQNYEDELLLIPKGLQIFLTKLPTQLKRDLVKLSIFQTEEEKNGVKDLLKLKDAPTPIIMEVGRNKC